MKLSIKQFFGEDIELEVRLFYLSTLLTVLESVLFIMGGLLLRININIIYTCIFIGVFCFVLFYLEYKFKKTQLLTYIFILYAFFFVFPLIMVISNFTLVEIPIYFIVGLAFSLILLSGKPRIFIVILQFLLDICILLHCYVTADKSHIVTLSSNLSEYIRIYVAVFSSSLICGILIGYRNRVLAQEMKQRQLSSKLAEEVNYAKDMFLVNVSHEIRTPLNAIIGTTEVVLESNASNHVKEMAFNISNSSHALLSITSDLLDFSRMNIDTLNVVKQQYDISLMLNDIINLLTVRLLDSNVDFYVDINPKLPRVLYGDNGKIRQIIINILSNAIKYTPKGYLIFKVDYELSEENFLELKMSVKDTGIGIKAEAIDKIFEPLHRSGTADVDRAIEGNGLGLALCKKLSAAMGGQLFCESVYGEGSTFYFNVKQEIVEGIDNNLCGYIKEPDKKVAFYTRDSGELINVKKILSSLGIEHKECLCDEDMLSSIRNNDYDYYLVDFKIYDKLRSFINEQISDWSKIAVICNWNISYSDEPLDFIITKPVNCLNISDFLNQTTSFAMRQQNFDGEFLAPDATVLIIDDNLVNLEVASNLLHRYHLKVLTATSGREGLSVLKNEKCDIVLLDYMMPDMDGIDTLKEIRAIDDSKISCLPVIALTANAVSGAREMFLNAGFDEYLSKPIDTNELRRILFDLLPRELIKVEM